MRKRISIGDLKLGMRVVGLDQGWLRSPFWVHRQLIKSEEDIEELRRAGISEVEIQEKKISQERQGPKSLDFPVDAKQKTGRDQPSEIEKNSQNHDQRASGDSHRPLSEPDKFDERLKVVREIHLEAISAVEQVFEGIKTGVELKSNDLMAVTQTLIASLMDHEGSLLAEMQLQRMKKFETSLFAHSVNVCVMALLVGFRSQLPEEELHILALGALLHDAGQMRLPRNLLTRNGGFTAEERRLYQSHPKLGATIISEGDGVPNGVLRVVSEHHERIDGRGFPWRRAGSAILWLAQLVGLIDRYDALISNRGGRPPVPPTLAIRRLYQLGLEGEFAMELVDQLIQCFGLYPVGSLVELNTGEQGWVIDVNQADSMRPTIRVLWGPGHVPLPAPRMIEISGGQDEVSPRRIRRVLNPVELGCSEGYAL